ISSVKKTVLASARRLRRRRRQASAQRLVCSCASVSSTYFSAMPGAVAISVPDPWVDDGVEQVDQQVRQGDDDGVEGEEPSDDVVVAREDACGELLAQAGDAKDVLDDD